MATPRSAKKTSPPPPEPRTLTLAVRHDDDIGSLLKDVTISRGGVVPSLNKALAKKQKSSKRSKATPSA
eukprot:gene472-252_t